jgi:hypothetical protein
MVTAYSTCDLETFASMVTPDTELYSDEGGDLWVASL